MLLLPLYAHWHSPCCLWVGRNVSHWLLPRSTWGKLLLSIESAVTGPGHIQTRLERDQSEGFSGWNCKTSDLKSQSESLLTQICHLCSQKESLPASRSTTLKANKDQKKKVSASKNDVYPRITLSFSFFLEKPFLDQASMTASEEGRECFRETPAATVLETSTWAQRKGETAQEKAEHLHRAFLLVFSAETRQAVTASYEKLRPAK